MNAWQLRIIRRHVICFAPCMMLRGAGMVMEVSPYLAHDTEATCKEAARLWEQVDRPNLMINIPVTKDGVASDHAFHRHGD